MTPIEHLVINPPLYGVRNEVDDIARFLAKLGAYGFTYRGTIFFAQTNYWCFTRPVLPDNVPYEYGPHERPSMWP